MLSKMELSKEVASIDALIRAIDQELAVPGSESTDVGSMNLEVEMHEALCELRRARGVRRVLISVLEPQRNGSGSLARGRDYVVRREHAHRVTQ
jgi:hypothetical protein